MILKTLYHYRGTSEEKKKKEEKKKALIKDADKRNKK